jgi:hypothetical protein
MNPRCKLVAGIAAVALGLLVASGCSKDIRLHAIPSLAGSGHATVRVVLTYDRNNVLTVTLSGMKDGRYVVWTSPSGDPSAVPVNVGQIRVEGGKGKIQTLTPLRKFTLLITEEDNGEARQPSPRVVFKSDKEIDW